MVFKYSLLAFAVFVVLCSLFSCSSHLNVALHHPPTAAVARAVRDPLLQPQLEPIKLLPDLRTHDRLDGVHPHRLTVPEGAHLRKAGRLPLTWLCGGSQCKKHGHYHTTPHTHTHTTRVVDRSTYWLFVTSSRLSSLSSLSSLILSPSLTSWFSSTLAASINVLKCEPTQFTQRRWSHSNVITSPSSMM